MTFNSADKIVIIGTRRFRVKTLPLLDIPAYLDAHGREPYTYKYIPQVFDEVLITKAKKESHEHPDTA